MNLAIVPVDRHFDAGNDDHAPFPADLDRARNRPLIVVVGDRDDLEAPVRDRVDQVLGLPETVAGQGVKVEIDRISRVDRLDTFGQVGLILSKWSEYATSEV